MMFPGLPRLEFSLSGAVQATQHPKEVGGTYRLAGNLVYVELDDSIEIRSESGSFPMKRIILMCDSDDEPMRDPFVTARRGLVLLRDSLRPIEVWHETPGSGV